jgi:hypothetical protein
MEENQYKYTTSGQNGREKNSFHLFHVVNFGRKNVSLAHVYIVSMPKQKTSHCNLKNILFPFCHG